MTELDRLKYRYRRLQATIKALDETLSVDLLSPTFLLVLKGELADRRTELAAMDKLWDQLEPMEA